VSGTAAIIGAGGIGCETALYLNLKGFQVSLFEQLEEIALDVEPITATDIKERLSKNGITVNVGCKVINTRRDTMRIERVNGEVLEASAGVIVWAAGRTPNRIFVRNMKASSFSGQLHVIGDAQVVGKIHDAIHTGYSVIKELSWW
jgi:pyruvate/2-oxoglutarate dehydrogenase complex dihydrolipoamide dehydrogenase (E3) component